MFINEKKITNYLPESAGSLMTKNVPTVSGDANVGEVQRLLKRQIDKFESINYVYVLDEDEKFEGVVSIKNLYHLSEATIIKDVMSGEVVTVDPETDQENVALLAVKNNIKAVPVVNGKGVFLGVVSSDNILKVLHSESVEDALRFAGSAKMSRPAVNIIKAGAWLHLRKRLPWLLLGLGGGILAAFVVRFFEESLQEQLMLAAFIPAVVYMADAVGAQTQTIFVRSLALTRTLNVKKYILRESKVAFSLAGLLGFLSFFIVFAWLGLVKLGVVLGLAMALTILAASGIGLFFPWLLQNLKYDPAIASGPFATVVRDIMSLLVYFAIASLLL